MDIGMEKFIHGQPPTMRYYSGYYKPCTSITDRGWCNIPKKTDKFSPTEQMIVAYHNSHAVYAYKGLFNRNIDYHWSGGILLDFKKIMYKIEWCSASTCRSLYSW